MARVHGFRLNVIMLSVFGGQLAGIEAQLRWEDYLASLSPAELQGMIARRAKAAGVEVSPHGAAGDGSGEGGG
jgi:hypothetical protein